MYGKQKNYPTGFYKEIVVFFVKDTLKTAFLYENLNQRRTQTGHFFGKSGHFFKKLWQLSSIFKQRARETHPHPHPSPTNCVPAITAY